MAALRAEPHPLAPRLARHLGARDRGDLDVLVRFRERDLILDLFEMVGRRAHAHALLPGGGLAEDIPRGLLRPRPRVLRRGCRRRSTSTRRSSTATRSGSSARKGIGLLSAEDAIALGQSGPVLRASGRRLGPARASSRTSPTTRSTSTCPSTTRATSTTATACTWTRCASRRGSSPSASTGSRRWRASRGSRTTARSCCRRARSCTPRWSR